MSNSMSNLISSSSSPSTSSTSKNAVPVSSGGSIGSSTINTRSSLNGRSPLKNSTSSSGSNVVTSSTGNGSENSSTTANQSTATAAKSVSANVASSTQNDTVDGNSCTPASAASAESGTEPAPRPIPRSIPIHQLPQRERQQYTGHTIHNRNSHHYYPHPHSSSSFSLNKNEEFDFTKPSECPVFRPTEEEFKNPLSYISKIRPIGEKYGIAKILPPKSWTPPFTVDVEKLKFTPRVQRLNELEAKTRIKLNFLDQIAKFWELQGSSLKIPMVERKALDLYSLHRVVQREGGIEQVTKERKWSKVATRMGYPAGKSIGAILKGHYERILHPFDIYTSGKVIDIKLETESDDKDYKPHGIVSRQQISPPNETTARRSKRFANSNASKESACGLGKSPIAAFKDEVKKEEGDDEAAAISSPVKDAATPEVRAHGPAHFGSKMAGGGGRNARSRMSMSMPAAPAIVFATPPPPKRKQKQDPLAKYICHICNRGDVEEQMLLCDGCDDSYHTFCLIPPLSDVPKGEWRCPKCVVEEVNKPTEAFGFEQAQREYTLQQFGEMADQFKADYFNMSVHLVPTELVEREFWRIVSSIDEDVTVEYGADLHTMDHGSGFPTKSSLYLLPGDQEYAESSWNLNNLPLLEESILGHINADISGMKVPWMYVGMCFATFCWHNEDHWSYSINYLHWGEPKTWYGVPGSRAEAFEETMKSTAPELFANQPDLLHQLVTIMNPNILMNSGVPVYRTDQHAGEFVITFPRAYHAGFNQGYNFAEAVNFAPADWMKMGRECINHYSTLRRFCVFSHDELVCKMALDPDKLNMGIATACYLDMAEMVDSEKKLRKSLLEWGVTKAERLAFELIPDDERQCDICKTTCFLSAVSCPCGQAIVCLRHYTELCGCEPERHVLKYRYTLDELPLMLKKLKVKAESFEHWLSKVRDALDPNVPTTISLNEMQNLAQEAEDKKFPNSVLLQRLNSAVLEAEKCVTVIQQLDINKMRTRTRNSNESAKYKLTMDELDLFVQEIDNLCCTIQEGHSVRELQAMGKEFVQQAKTVLAEKLNKVKESELERLIEEGTSLCIELEEIKLLKDRLQQANWFNRVREFRDAKEKLPIVQIQSLLKEGLHITPEYTIEKELVALQKIMIAVEEWEEIAKNCFRSGTQHELPEIDLLLEKAEMIEAELPSENALKDAVKKAKEWLYTVAVLQSNEHYPYFHTLESVVNRGRNIPFHLEELARMESHLASACDWKEKTSKVFLRKQSNFILLDVLSPRIEAVMIGSKIKRKPLEEQFTENMVPAQMVDAFKNAEEKELRDMRELRKVNTNKSPLTDKYCICKRSFHGIMYHCQLCQDWFHDSCVPPPKNTVRPRPSNVSQNIASPVPIVPALNCRDKDRETKYLCPSCMRSRRPRLETILSLLVSLQRLPIRLPEGEALQCLTERSMNWQDRVRQAFASEEVASALATLSSISAKSTSSPAPPPSESVQIPTTSAADSTNEQQKLATMAKKKQASSSSRQVDASDTESDDEFLPLQIDESVMDADSTVGSTTKDDGFPSSPTRKIEHAYSAPTIAEIPANSSAAADCVPTTTTTADLPLVQLGRVARETLEDLMMEGDLLEVSLDETLHLWRILNAAKPSMTDLEYIQSQYNITATSSAENLVSNAMRKRRSDDATNGGPTKKSSKGDSKKMKRGGRKFVAKKQQQEQQVDTTLTSTVGETASKSSLETPKKSNENDAPNKQASAATTALAGAAASTVNPSRASPATLTSSAMSSKKRKRQTKKASQTQSQSTKKAATSTSDDEDECSAQNCHRPSGREVDWVQCDGGCNKWFHMFCVGLDKSQIKPDDDYICKRCTVGKSSRSNNASPVVAAKEKEGTSVDAPVVAVVATPEVADSAASTPEDDADIDEEKDKTSSDTENAIESTTTTESKRKISANSS